MVSFRVPPAPVTPRPSLIVPSGAAHENICCRSHQSPRQAVHLITSNLLARDAADHDEAGGDHFATAKPSLRLRCHGSASARVSTWCVWASSCLVVVGPGHVALCGCYCCPVGGHMQGCVTFLSCAKALRRSSTWQCLASCYPTPMPQSECVM